jgi:hypothetical protein
VRQVLRESCYACHSNETRLSWFDEVVPAYWLVARDVKEARAHLNFSEIGRLPEAQQKAILYDAVNKIQLGAMPLPSYLHAHPEATVSPAALQTLRAYLNSSETYKAADTAAISSSDAEYDNWMHGDTHPTDVRLEPNGIAFLPDYKNWKTISSTERFDNYTIREILGNDVAVKAIADRHINPWPDGTTFAKVAWAMQLDNSGIAHSGKFVQVEFMIKDHKKYASTKGWGFGRWRGLELKPYGTNADFANECVECHTPLRRNDYVFTMPMRGQQ